jgi:WD40 repeat protein
MSQSTKRVFLSYGTGDALEVAEWLHGALTSRGYQVFWDKEGLRETTGTAWDRHLEEAIRTHDVVVALMSPHSVRPEGECRNEISFAKDLGKPIVPVMVRQCERPLRVHDLQYVDLEAFPRVGELERSAWLEEIIRFIENGVPVDPALSELRRRFRPLDYERVLRRNSTDPFVGREWLFDRIDQWLADPDAPSTLFVVGGPGVGKTSAMAHWCRGRLKVGAYHFCDHAQPDTARDVVASLAGQLLSLQALHPSYPEALRVLDTANHDTGDVSSGARDWTAVEWFRKLVLDPLRQDPPDTPWVLVMDALDEALPDVRKMLRECHSELPPQVRLLITSRPDRDLVAWYRGALEIDASSDDNQCDLRHYVEERLQLLKEAGRIESALDIVERFAVRLVDASAGTFLYCAEVLDSIAARHRAVSDDTVLPEGLGGVYAEFLGRNFPDPEGSAYRELQAALEVALGAKQTVDDRFIGAVLDIDEDDVADLRCSLGSLMVSGHEWRFFHKSFADWLGDGEASSYGVRPGRGVRRILKALDGSGAVLQKYALRWRAAHLIDEGHLDGARALLTSFAVLKSRVEAGMVRGILDDMDALVRAASGTNWSIPEELRVWQRLFRRRREFWEQFTNEFHQDCLNEAEGLPTTESAKAIPIGKPWIRWVNKPEHEVRHGWEWMVRDASCAAFSPDGNTVAVGGTDGSLRLLDAETGYEKWRVRGHDLEVTSVAFSSDCSRVLTTAWDATAVIWDYTTGAELRVLSGHKAVVVTGVYTNDGSRVLTASEDCTVRIWDASNGNELILMQGKVHPIQTAKFSPDEMLVLIVYFDNTVQLWDVSTGAELVKSIESHALSMTYGTFSPDGSKVLTTSRDKTARIWDVCSGSELVVYKDHTLSVNSASISLDGLIVVTASADRTARIWNVSNGSTLLVLEGHDSEVLSVVFSVDCSKVMTTSNDKTARIWDSTSGAELLVLSGFESTVKSAVFSPDGAKVLTVAGDQYSEDFCDNVARVWHTSPRTQSLAQKGHKLPVRIAKFSPDGSKVLTVSDDKIAYIWDVLSGAMSLVLSVHVDRLGTATFTEDSSTVLIIDRDRTIRIWDTSSGAMLSILQGSNYNVMSASLSPDSSLVVTTSMDTTARIWDISSGVEIMLLKAHHGMVMAASFSPDCTRVVTAAIDWTARIWNVSSGLVSIVINGHKDAVESAIFSSDGTKLLTVSWDKTARIWDASTGAELACLPITGKFLRAVSYPDSFELVTSSGQSLYRWVDGTQISDSDPPLECPIRPTLIGNAGSEGICLRLRGNTTVTSPALHLETKFELYSHPTDPLSFVAGCADGSVRFFRLEGVDLPVIQ